MSSMDAYGYAGVGTCVGVMVGLLFGFILGELAWSVISFTAIGSILGTVIDSRTTTMGEIQGTPQLVQLDD